MMRAKDRNRKKDAATVFRIHEKFFAFRTGCEASGGFPPPVCGEPFCGIEIAGHFRRPEQPRRRVMVSARHYPGLNSPGFARKTDKIEKP